MTALLILLGCSLAWVGFDVSRKALVARVPPLALMFLLALLQAPVLAVWWLIEGGGFGAGYTLPAAGSVALNIVANVAFIYAFRLSPISVTVPLLSLTPVFAALFAIPLLDEIPTLRQWVGIALVVVGALLISRGRGEGLGPAALLRAFAREPGARLMVLVALSWSVTTSLDKLAIAVASPPAHAVVLALGVAAGILVLLAASGRMGEMREVLPVLPLFVVALLLSAAALGLQLLAIGLLPISVVETVKRGLGSVAALAIGSALFGEPLNRGRVVAVVLMSVGVALVLL